MKICPLLLLLPLSVFSGCRSSNPNADLAAAIRGNSASGAQEAIDAGADVNLISQGGRTPLMDAVEVMSGEPIVQSLLTAGADPNLSAPSPDSLPPLHLAIKSHQLKAAALLLRHKAAANKVVHEQTPLMLAKTPAEIVLLVKAGANPNLITPGGNSVMDITGTHAGVPTLWKALQKAGGKPRRPSWLPPGAKVVPATPSPWPENSSPLNPVAPPPLR